MTQRLPSVPCKPGESYRALVTRTAALYETSARYSARLLGYGKGEDQAGRDMQVPDAATLDTLSETTGLAQDQIRGMFLQHVAAPYLPDKDVNAAPVREWWTSPVVHQFCSVCRSTDPYTLPLLWRVNLLPACPEHGILLSWEPDTPAEPVTPDVLAAQRRLTGLLNAGRHDRHAARAAQAVAALIELAAEADCAAYSRSPSGVPRRLPEPRDIARYLPLAVDAVTTPHRDADSCLNWRQILRQAIELRTTSPTALQQMLQQALDAGVAGDFSLQGLYCHMDTRTWRTAIYEPSMPIATFLAHGAGDLIHDAYTALTGDAPTSNLALRLTSIDARSYFWGGWEFLSDRRAGWGWGVRSTLTALHREMKQRGSLEAWEQALRATRAAGTLKQSYLDEFLEHLGDTSAVPRDVASFWYTVRYLGHGTGHLAMTYRQLGQAHARQTMHLCPALQSSLIEAAQTVHRQVA